MADNQNQMDQTPQEKVQGALEKFRELPKNVQIGIIAGVGVLFLMMTSGGEDPQPVRKPAAVQTVDAPKPQPQKQAQGTGGFQTADPSRESLRTGFVTQQRAAMAEMRAEMKADINAEKERLTETREEVRDIFNQVQQMIETFNQQARANDESYNTYREELARLAEEARRAQERQTGAQVIGGAEGGAQVQALRRRNITQHRIGGGAGVNANPDQALLNIDNDTVRAVTNSSGEVVDFEVEAPAPFIPPLGFVKGTLINGVDALAGGGQATPSLVRLSGVYKTAMNSTVDLSGCFALVEFEGDVSTERALGKPSRMTCVYPDQGAVTYDLTGYVVDAEDGVIGVPGVFYEGDASRLAAAMVAEFAGGIASIIQENQNTNTVDSEGTAQQTLTGSAVRAEFAGGVEAATSRLSEYLFERANRVVPFVRLDATRDVHIVLLSGTELRREGGAWSLLFDGVKADQARREAENLRRQAAEDRKKQNSGI